MPHRRRLILIISFLTWAAGLFPYMSASPTSGAPQAGGRTEDGDVSIRQITPDKRGGEAYRLVYTLEAPIDVCWRFKTDFDNPFLTQHKYIRDHRVISRNGDTVITEDRYANGSGAYFRWQTKMFPEAHRLDFVLLNPEQCGQKFHYGHIRLEPEGEATRVSQVAYFDFWGATSWANYPWKGGMKDFLRYTARWEQETILRLKDRYRDHGGQ